MKLSGRVLGSLAIMAGVAVAPLTLASSAGASLLEQTYGPTSCTASASVSPTTVAAGQSITVSVTGNCANDSFSVVLHSTSVTLGTVTTNSSGSGSGSFTIPTNISSGTHTITVGDLSGNGASATVVVTGGTASSSTSLPITGTNTPEWAAVGAIALAAGGLLVLSSRKRRAKSFQ